MANGHTPPITELVGEFANVVQVQFRRVRAEVQVHVYVYVELAGHLEYAVYLPVGVGVGVGSGANHGAALLKGLHHQLVRSRIVEQALLREDAHFDVYGPLVLIHQGFHALQSSQPYDRVHFKLGAHVGGAVQDALLQGALAPLVNVLGRELPLGFGYLLNGLRQVALFRPAPFQDAGLVQVDVSLYETRSHQAAANVDLLPLGVDNGLYGGDAALVNADVYGRRVRPIVDAGVPQDSIH